MNNYSYRLAKRDCYCRVCDKVNKKDVDKVIHIYSSRNRGQNIYICRECLIELSYLIRLDDLETELSKINDIDRKEWV